MHTPKSRLLRMELKSNYRKEKGHLGHIVRNTKSADLGSLEKLKS